MTGIFSTAIFPPGPRSREIQVAFAAWGLYIVCQAIYCLIYARIMSAEPFDIQGMLLWAAREWGMWLLITPFIFSALRRYIVWPDRLVVPCVKLVLCVLTVALTLRVGFDHITGTRNIRPSLLIYFPRYLAAVAAVLAMWLLFLRPERRAPAGGLEAGNRDCDVDNADGGVAKSHQTLLVGKGRDESLIQVARIQYISAAGNYAEICCDNQLYLMRATMKQLEELLPPSLFLRIHRSHIININEIDRIRTQRSGCGSVYLRCGKMLNISRNYKSRLQRTGAIPAG